MRCEAMSASLENLLRDARLDLVMARIEKDPGVIQQVIEQLDSKIRSIRFNAIIILGKMGSKSSSALAKLAACLEDNDWSVCRESVRSLGNLGNIAESSVLGLCKLVDNREPSIRKEVAIALGKIKHVTKETISCLLSRLKDTNAEVRAEAARSIGLIGAKSPEINNALINLLQDEDWRVRNAVAVSIGELGASPDESISSLLKALHDKDWRVRNRIIDSLIKFGDVAVPKILLALDDHNIHVKKAVIEVLGDIKSDNPVILKKLEELLKDRREAIRGKVIDALRSIGVNAIPTFLAAIRSAGNKMRIELISGSGGIKGDFTSSIPEIIQTLQEIDVLKSRYSVILPEKDINFKKKMGFYLKRAWTSLKSFIEDPLYRKVQIRAEITRALGKYGNGSDLTVDTLIDALHDFRNIVRRSAALSLGELGDTASKAIPALIQALNDKFPDVRWRASEALGKMGVNTPEIISGLEKLLYDQFDNVSVSAEFALDKIKNQSQVAR